jgi:hypothetical protein
MSARFATFFSEFLFGVPGFAKDHDRARFSSCSHDTEHRQKLQQIANIR